MLASFIVKRKAVASMAYSEHAAFDLLIIVTTLDGLNFLKTFCVNGE